MDSLHEVETFVADPAVHLLQTHPFGRFQTNREIRGTGAGLTGLLGRKRRENKLFQAFPERENFVDVFYAGRADIVSPLVVVPVHFHERTGMQDTGKFAEIGTVGRFVPVHHQVDKTLRRKDSVQVQVSQPDAFHLELTVFLAGAEDFFNIRRHDVVHFPADPDLVEVLVRVVVFDKTGDFQEGGIVGKVLVLDFVRSGMDQIFQQTDVPLHQMGHPPARLSAQVGVQLIHQLGLPEPGTELAPQDVPEVLEFRLLEAVQNGMEGTFFHQRVS